MPAVGEHHPAFEEYCECIFELAEDDIEVVQARIHEADEHPLALDRAAHLTDPGGPQGAEDGGGVGGCAGGST